eukprot:CAMPEP_0177655810 /NCGR_PEP_ID=MMETSP0447-20121125/15188_1 /TAXON_ID=0 /ORGANISM="Stygamoeba regulata, Strain BSH-02190019" /LENGTH=501 /DNA_ID=CAMNT_0019159799 /DNA_START=81 /DNA_END=1586 /DNA_ORIENTATION=+
MMLRSSLSLLSRPAIASRFAPSLAARSYAAASGPDDIVVVGGGPGGYVAAIKAAQLGLKVTCVEKRGALGGTCLNVGCIPSKALLHSTHLYHEATHNFAKHGIKVSGVEMDVAKMMDTKEKVVHGLTSGIEYLFSKNKVNYVKGTGRISGPKEVSVTLADGTEKKIATENILIATGSDVMSLPGIEIDEKRIVSSTGALSLAEVPKKMVVIGGGVIGLELGSVWARLGSEVTVVEFLPEIAAGADKTIAKKFQKVLARQGIKFQMSTKVTSAKNLGDKVQLTIESAKGGAAKEIDADVVLVSVGRRPYTDKLGLDKVGVKMTDRGVIVTDEHFRTNVPSIRAIGDVVKGPMLAHKAEEEGIAAVENIINPKAGHVNYDAIPSVIYTNPEVAWVGKTAEQLKAEGREFKTGEFPLKANSRARANGDHDPEETVIMYADAKTDEVLGVHILAIGAGELIGEMGLAVNFGSSSEDIAITCHAHPTVSEAIKEAAMAVTGKPIHF